MSKRDEFNPEDSQIANCVRQTLSLLKEVVASHNLQERQASLVDSRLSRLKAWASSTNAHHLSGAQSLDQTLRDSPDVQSHVLSLLKDLLSSAHELSAASESDARREFDDNGKQNDVKAVAEIDLELASFFSGSDLQDKPRWDAILDQIDHTISCLMRLSVAFRSLGSLDRCSQYCDITFKNHFYRVDLDHARSQYPKAYPIIWDRLAIANVRRRAYFKYRGENIRPPVKDSSSDDTKTAVKHRGLTTAATPRPQQPNDLSGTSQPDSCSEVSDTSYTASSVYDEESFVLRPPEKAWEGPFSCPLCHTLISINNYKTWRSHVFQDLKPYVCLALNCPTPYILYKKRSQWEYHMRKAHWIYFTCPYCYSESVFVTLDALRTHALSLHGQDIGTDDMKTLYDIAIRYDHFKAMDDCPLCSEVNILSGKHYVEHVGNHLDLLALAALPDENPKDNPGSGRSEKIEGLSQVNSRDEGTRMISQVTEEATKSIPSDTEGHTPKNAHTKENENENLGADSESPITRANQQTSTLSYPFDHMTNWLDRLRMAAETAKSWAEGVSKSDLGGSTAESCTAEASKSRSHRLPSRISSYMSESSETSQKFHHMSGSRYEARKGRYGEFKRIRENYNTGRKINRGQDVEEE